MFTVSHPIWAKGKSTELNLHLIFDIPVFPDAAIIRLTASTAYQLFQDGQLTAYGPARAGDGHFRVDEWAATAKTTITVRVAGYYCDSFQYCRYPSFLNLEILDSIGNVLFATGRDEITCHEDSTHIRATDKQARQRVFTEVYDLHRAPVSVTELEVLPDPQYLPRRVAPFSDTEFDFVCEIGDFAITHLSEPSRPLTDGLSPFNATLRWLAPECGNHFEPEECNLYKEAHLLAFTPCKKEEDNTITADRARMFDFGIDRAGLVGMDVKTNGNTVLYGIFDEILTDGDVKAHRSNQLTAFKYILPEGEYHLLTFEPYTMRYLKLCVTQGSLTVKRLYLKEQAGIAVKQLSFADKQLQMIYDAAANTYRQNSTDIFMDCPSRERAGWLCDSFFTGRSEAGFAGKNTVETNFLENFARHTAFHAPEGMVKGMVPMLYPGSTDYINKNRNWISNWALWLVLEIAEYAQKRDGSPDIVAALKETVYRILSADAQSENELGLLENLPGWIFVEWSRANDEDVVCGVNYPSNMLYSGAMLAAGETYHDQALIDKALKLRETIRKYAWNGTWFVDNATRVKGELVQTANTTETCQYYAFFFHIASPDTYPELWKKLTTDFGPQRKITPAYPDVPFSNSFIGNYLRLDVLRENGMYDLLLNEIRGYFGFMAEANGALWEYDTPKASCCHGFASYAGVLLMELKEKLNIQ